jgi:selenocysteine lyase/cysteine desulfurase
MGALYVSPRSAAAVNPTFVGVRGLLDAGRPERGLRPDARRFDASSFHAPSVAGMARSCGWLSMYVGLDWIFARAGELARRAFDQLAGTPGVVVLTRVARLATMVTFRLQNWSAGDALDELGRRTFVIARHVPSMDAIRISTAFFTTEAELDRFCDAIADLAAHTPETLARRPALSILGP